MTATLPASTTAPVTRASHRPRLALPGWTQHLHLLSTALLITAVIALAVIAFQSDRVGNGGGSQLNGAVPVATVPDDAESSSIPEPTRAECSVTPLTRDEVIQHFTESNTATAPDVVLYEQPIEPTAEQSRAIMGTFRAWQACQGTGAELRFQTPWYTANGLGLVFHDADGRDIRPLSDPEIARATDAWLTDLATPAAQLGTPVPEATQPEIVPVPADATPVTRASGSRNVATIFAEDIVITGPDRATATAYFVDTTTRQIVPDGPALQFDFVNVDGQWLIDGYREGGRG